MVEIEINAEAKQKKSFFENEVISLPLSKSIFRIVIYRVLSDRILLFSYNKIHHLQYSSCLFFLLFFCILLPKEVKWKRAKNLYKKPSSEKHLHFSCPIKFTHFLFVNWRSPSNFVGRLGWRTACDRLRPLASLLLKAVASTVSEQSLLARGEIWDDDLVGDPPTRESY